MTSDPTHPAAADESPDERQAGRVLVLGASGYVGGRLVPELLRLGWGVRCLVRSSPGLPPAWADEVEEVVGDLLEPDTLTSAFADVDQVVYLVHSLDTGEGFEERERQCAENARKAAEAAGVRRIVYLSGLGDDQEALSAHLGSRHATGAELADGAVPVVELRAAIVIGAGSASFEMLRSLVEVLPVMVTPRWVSSTTVQPIAIADLLTYLVAALEAPLGEGRTVVEIGGQDSMSYRDLMALYAEVAGLKRRLVVPVPVLTPLLSARWVHLVTPLPKTLSRSLIDSLQYDVVVTDDSARTLSGHETMHTRTAIETAIAAVADLDIPTRWSGITPQERAAQPRPWDPEWAGGTVYEDCREVCSVASAERVMRTVRGIGGERGWYGFGLLWAVRGLFDQLIGGVGLRRGRRHPDEIEVGEALDFWRVEANRPELFRLRAEMKVPGEAWLEWSVGDDADGRTCVTQRARFAPAGLWGRAYWWAVVPFHGLIFPIMLKRIARAAEAAAD